jgi:hypothetical protein
LNLWLKGRVGISDQSNSPSGWYLKNEIHLGHLITTATVAISVILYANNIEQSVAVV